MKLVYLLLRFYKHVEKRNDTPSDGGDAESNIMIYFFIVIHQRGNFTLVSACNRLVKCVSNC